MISHRHLEIDDAIAMLVFGENLPFSLLDSALIRKTVSLLNPSYKLSSSKKLRTTLLDKIFGKLRQKNYTANPHKGIMMIDGWKNSANSTKQVAVMVKPRWEKEIFVKSYDFSTNTAGLLESINASSQLALQSFNISELVNIKVTYTMDAMRMRIKIDGRLINLPSTNNEMER